MCTPKMIIPLYGNSLVHERESKAIWDSRMAFFVFRLEKELIGVSSCDLLGKPALTVFKRLFSLPLHHVSAGFNV